jgi:hypothetical protein
LCKGAAMKTASMFNTESEAKDYAKQWSKDCPADSVVVIETQVRDGAPFVYAVELDYGGVMVRSWERLAATFKNGKASK